MAFTCKICSREIQVGEAMVPNMKMEVAHDSCVQRECQIPKAIVPPITISTDQMVTLKIERIEIIGDGFNKTVTITPQIEPCLMPTKSLAVCGECQKSAISMCPACRAYVHQDYGYNGQTCSLKHEAKCAGAAESRNPHPKYPIISMKPIFDAEPIKNRNGKSKPKKNGSRR